MRTPLEKSKVLTLTALLPLALLALSHGCSRDKKETPPTATPTTGVGVYAFDPSVLAAAVADLVDDAASAVAESETGDARGAFTRTCAVDDESDPVKVTVAVDARKSVSNVTTFGRGKSALTLTAKFEGGGKSKREWVRPETGLIDCQSSTQSSKPRAAIDWSVAENVENLTLAVLEEARTGARTVSKADGGVVYDRKYVLSGKRNTTWKAVGDAEDGQTLPRLKSVTVDVSRTVSLQNARGENVSVQAALKTKDGAPLSVKVERGFVEGDEGLQDKLKTTTIEKGTYVAKSAKAKTTLEASFADLRFDHTRTDACTPVSGKVTGTVTEEGSEAKVGFAVDFADKRIGGDLYVSLAIDGGLKTE